MIEYIEYFFNLFFSNKNETDVINCRNKDKYYYWQKLKKVPGGKISTPGKLRRYEFGTAKNSRSAVSTRRKFHETNLHTANIPRSKFSPH